VNVRENVENRVNVRESIENRLSLTILKEF